MSTDLFFSPRAHPSLRRVELALARLRAHVARLASKSISFSHCSPLVLLDFIS